MWDLRKGWQGQPGRGRRGTWWEQEGHTFEALQAAVVVPSQSLGHSTRRWRENCSSHMPLSCS